MSNYQDPYWNPPADTRQNEVIYNTNTNHGPAAEYNPYSTNNQPSYQYDNTTTTNNNAGSYNSYLNHNNTDVRRRDSANERERGLPAVPSQNTLVDGPGVMSRKLSKREERHSFTPGPRMPGEKDDIKTWRKEQHSDMWTAGSRGRCVGRFCCCTIMIALLLFVSIFLTLVLWVRPPQVLFTGVQPTTSGSTFEATTNNQFKVNLNFGIFVNNPNYFDATFSTISADIKYPLNGQSEDVGGGSQNDITFKAHSATNFTFPFSFTYDKNADPDEALIKDLVSRCGFVDPSTKEDLKIDYTLTLRLKILFLKVGPSIGGSANFACPVTAAQIKPFLAGLGIAIPGLL